MDDALSELSGQPPVDPEAQSVVTDFLDYTEFFPSDLYRSLALLRKLDQAFQDEAQRVQDLTTTYSNIPHLDPKDQPDPRHLRGEISSTLDHALRCRESTLAEASRLCQVAYNLQHRLVGIKAKLEAMPKPPSREPTPQPTSPTRTRKAAEADRTPRLKLFTDGEKHNRRAPGSVPKRKKPVLVVPGDVLPPVESFSDDSSGSETELPHQKSPVRTSPIKLPHEKKSLSLKIPKPQKSATPKPPKTPKSRVPGLVGTNAHSSVAGISVSNAMAALTPPPEKPQLGSEWAPWLELTMYELHQIRRRMKKSAIWRPSEVMLVKELDARGRGEEKFRKAKAEAEARGETILDEPAHVSSGGTKQTPNDVPDSSEKHVLTPVVSATDQPLENGPIETEVKEAELKEAEVKPETSKKEKQSEKPPKHKVDQESKNEKFRARQQAELEMQQKMTEAMRKAQEESDNLNQVLYGMKPVMTPTSAVPSIETPTTATSTSKKKSNKKRKRESEPSLTTPASAVLNASQSLPSPAERTSSPKKLRLVAPKPDAEPAPESAVEETPVSGTEHTTQVPLAPEGPSAPVDEAVPVDPMLLDEQKAPDDEELDPPTAEPVPDSSKPRTPTPAPVITERTPSAPPKSPLTEPVVDHEADPEPDEPDELAQDEDKLQAAASPRSSRKSASKSSAISIKLPNAEATPEIPDATVTEKTTETSEKTTRQSTRRNRPTTPKPSAMAPPPSTEMSPEHRGMTETAASRRSSRARPGQILVPKDPTPPPPPAAPEPLPTSTPAPAPAPPQKPVLETSASTRPKRETAGRKESVVSAPEVTTNTPASPTTTKRKSARMTAAASDSPVSPKKRRHSSTTVLPPRSQPSHSKTKTTSPVTAEPPLPAASTFPQDPKPNEASLHPHEVDILATFPHNGDGTLKVPPMDAVNTEGENIYCLCRDVDHGTMIACDGAKCPVDWFHLECVGLEKKPSRREIWVCPLCRERDARVAGKV